MLQKFLSTCDDPRRHAIIVLAATAIGKGMIREKLKKERKRERERGIWERKNLRK